MTGFPWKIDLNDSWFEYDYTEYKNVLDIYLSERQKLKDLVHDATKPIPCKSWTKCYVYGDEPENLASLWTEINNYIQEHNDKDGWEYSHIDTEKVDVNTDPYDEFENLTDKYTVYAYVKDNKDFRDCEEYLNQYNRVKSLYKEVMTLKERIDKKLENV